MAPESGGHRVQWVPDAAKVKLIEVKVVDSPARTAEAVYELHFDGKKVTDRILIKLNRSPKVQETYRCGATLDYPAQWRVRRRCALQKTH
jgi:hypothetical protein